MGRHGPLQRQETNNFFARPREAPGGASLSCVTGCRPLGVKGEAILFFPVQEEAWLWDSI